MLRLRKKCWEYLLKELWQSWRNFYMSQTGCWTGRSIAVQTVHCSPVSEGCTGASGLLAVAAGLKQCGMFLLSAVLCTVRPGQLHSLVNIRRNAITTLTWRGEKPVFILENVWTGNGIQFTWKFYENRKQTLIQIWIWVWTIFETTLRIFSFNPFLSPTSSLILLIRNSQEIFELNAYRTSLFSLNS